ncbi:PREDICTED: uncharacterized protein LOC107190809 [Dufourea novaeangliae]|uniref:uncharacterized protein LOC107190809 n=1 Tax=Dufourea novaeangliae TaxID=178035 RepID=UPI0007673B02|nr:PREDICTED: uncharacterized protein LOC107190809 [Dufourea novaeangliae]
MRTTDEAVMTMTERIHMNKIARVRKECSEGVKSKNITWLLDSGSTSHMVWDPEMFDKLCSEEREIMLADKGGRKLVSNGIGEVPLRQEDIENKVRLKNVLCVPDLNTNLSVAKFTDYGYKVTFDEYGAKVYKEPGKIQMKAVRKGNAYYVESIGTNSEVVTATFEDNIWHKRLGHVNKRIIEKMKKEELVIGMKEENRMNIQCKGCVERKACRKIHPKLERRKSKEIMELWHLDLIGPVHPTSKGDRRSFVMVKKVLKTQRVADVLL